MKRVAILGLALVASQHLARAQVVVDPTTGHAYELVTANETWDQARVDASQQMFSGVPGHLATITSPAEQSFVVGSFSVNLLLGCWLGGYQPAGSAEPDGGWSWITGEPWTYSCWAPNEPNNAAGYGGGTHEDGLQFKASNHWTDWNDFWRGSTEPSWVRGYIVEWDGAFTSLQLTISSAPTFTSIPSQFGWNITANYSRVTIQNATTAQVTDVAVKFSDATTGQEIAVARYGVGGPSPVHTISASQLDAPIAILPQSYFSSLPSIGAAPPCDRVRVTVQVRTAMAYGEVDLPVLHALWRMPPGIPRFGSPDLGLGYDDWCRKGAYEWLVAWHSVLRSTAVNDISKEHGGTFSPHTTHKKGSDIDVAHFTNLTGASPIVGSTNYQRLTELVAAAIAGSVTAKLRVANWLANERAGLAPLLADSKVAQIRTGLGASTVLLPTGWLRQLLVSGSVTTISGVQFSFGLPWMPTGWRKRAFDLNHNDHSHIDLDDSKL